MDKKETKFDLQEAPFKNTDKAFVKVKEDGSPDIGNTSNKEKGKDLKERPTGENPGPGNGHI
jgi:hypothetical protein